MILASLALAGSQEDFAAANAVLASGDLAAAEAGYRAILASGMTDGNVYFNLGNVLYRQGRVPLAIAAWRRAQARLPRDPDVRANLDFARRAVTDHVEPAEPTPAFAPWQAALTPSEADWLGAGMAGLALLGFASRRRVGVVVPAMGLGLGGLLAAGGEAARRGGEVVVVTAEEVAGTSDLGGGVELFTLHAGAEVVAVEAAGGHTLVALPDERRAWFPDGALASGEPDEPFPRPAG
jgi:hypothetical protein